VKTPRTNLRIEGDVPPPVLKVLQREYGKALIVTSEGESDDDELVDIFETDFYKEIKKKMIPGDYVRIYRENHGLTQSDLGKKLGVSRAFICDIEKGRRSISKEMAKKLSKMFNISISRFI